MKTNTKARTPVPEQHITNGTKIKMFVTSATGAAGLTLAGLLWLDPAIQDASRKVLALAPVPVLVENFSRASSHWLDLCWQGLPAWRLAAWMLAGVAAGVVIYEGLAWSNRRA